MPDQDSRPAISPHAAIIAAATLIASSLCSSLSAQSPVSFTGAQSIVPLSPGIMPASVAVDAAGNLYIANIANDQILKAGWIGTSYTVTVIADASSGISCPAGLAVDSSGSVYIADSCAMQVLKETPSNGSYTQTVIANASANGLDTPDGVAVDSSGNVYIADQTNLRILKESLSNGTYTQSVIASSLLGPRAVAVDIAGNLYVADASTTTSQSQVLLLAPNAGPYTQTTIASNSANGLNTAAGVTVDTNGNVFIADSGSGSVWLETPATGGYTQSLFAAPNRLIVPAAVAADAGGSIYVADLGAGDVQKLAWPVANAGQVPAGSKSQAAQLTFKFTSAAKLNATTGWNVLSLGVPNAEFTDAGTGSCTAGATYAAGTICTVDVFFAPKFTGTVSGAVTLSDSQGNTLATAPLAGIGTGPQLIRNTSSLTEAAANLGMASDVAIDAAGSIYVADEGSIFLNAQPGVYKINPKTGATQPLGAGWQLPVGLALDGAGGLYISDYAQAAVFRIAPGGAVNKLHISVQGPIGLALDAAGNLYVADTAGAAVYKLTPSGAVTTIGSGWTAPDYISVDAAGDLFVSDFASGVYEVTPANVQTLITDQIESPQGIKVDAAGDVYVASGSTSDQTVYEIPAGGKPIALIAEPGTPYPRGIALDRSGNLFVANSNAGESLSSSQIVELDRVDPAAAIAFPTATTVQTTDKADQPATATFQNIGNQPLAFSTPATGNNPSYPAGFSVDTKDTNLCTSAAPLALGAACDISMIFAPLQAGAISASVVLTSNSLNLPSAVQSVAVTGTAVGIPQTIAFTWSPVRVAYGGTPVTLAAAASSGLPVVFNVLTGPGRMSGAKLSFTGAGTVVVAAKQSGNADYNPAVEAKRSIQVAKAKLTVTANNLIMQQGAHLPALTYKIKGLVGHDTQKSAITGAPVLTTSATSKSKPGKYTISATAGKLSAKNYSFNFVKGTLTIAK